MSDNEGSVFGDLSDAVGHGLQGAADLVSTELYGIQAAGEAGVGAASHLVAGAAEAVGAEETGQSVRAFADHQQDEASASIHQAGRELSHAGDEFFGGVEMPSMPEIPPVQWGPSADSTEYGTEYPEDGSAEG
jgi:hypothetical protein